MILNHQKLNMKSLFFSGCDRAPPGMLRWNQVFVHWRIILFSATVEWERCRSWRACCPNGYFLLSM